MPPSLTVRQRQFLDFIREYVRQNEYTPSLKEIREHFQVKAPTANKILKALMNKGFLYFERSSEAGFYIRLIERAGEAESIVDVILAGQVDRFGEFVEFNDYVGSFPVVLQGANREDIFGLVATEPIPQADMRTNDFLIFDREKKPQPGDICLALLGKRYFLIIIVSKTLTKEEITPDDGLDYPIPEALSHPEYEQQLHFFPLAYEEEMEEMFPELYKGKVGLLSPDWVVGTALRLVRPLHHKKFSEE